MKCECLLYIFFLHNFIFSNHISQIEIDDDFSIELEKGDKELQILKNQIKDFQKILKLRKDDYFRRRIQNLINLLNESEEIQERKRQYFEDMKETLYYLNIELTQNKNKVKNFNSVREDNGLKRVNHILQELMNSNHVKNELEKLVKKFQKIFNEMILTAIKNLKSNNSTSKTSSSNIKSHKNSTLFRNNISNNTTSTSISNNLRVEASSKYKYSTDFTQFGNRRIWSSFRLEEDNSLEEKNSTKIYPTGRQIARSCITSFLGATRPNFCSKSKENYLSQEILCPNGYRVVGTSCIENCPEGFELFGGVCWKSCSKGLYPCGNFCGDKECKNKMKFIMRGFNIPEFLTLDHPEVNCPTYFKKRNNICIAECELLGMIPCGSSGCASSSKMCNKFNYDFERNITLSYTSLLGHLYSLKSSLSFDYSDKINFNKNVLNLLSYVRTNENMMNETFRIYKRINSNFESKEFFLNYVSKYASRAFKNLNDVDELLRIEKVCKRVSTNLLENIIKKRNKYDLDYLSKNVPTPYILSCNSMLIIFDNEKCVKNLTHFTKRLGLLHLGTLSTLFIKPDCNFDYFQS
jgi:hypothetical protein